MKFYISKYALTKGIIELNGEICVSLYGADAGKEQDFIKVYSEYPTYYHYEGKEWHRDRDSAIKRAYEMKLKKIKSLEKQIEKIKKMEFE